MAKMHFITLLFIFIHLHGAFSQCNTASECSLYSPKCENNVCVACTSDADCKALSSNFIICGEYGSCEASVNMEASYNPYNIAATIIVFFLYAAVVVLLIIASVGARNSAGVFSTKVSSTENSGTSLKSVDE